MNTITVTIILGGNADSFTCDLTDEQLARLVSEGVISADDEPGTYWFDDDRIGEDWDAGDFGAAELIELADTLLRLPRHNGDLTDAEALDLIAYCLSAREWSSSFLEDIDTIVGRTSHASVMGAWWAKH